MKAVELIKMCVSETYSKVCVGKCLSAFPIQKNLKQEDALSPLLFNLALEYSIRKVQENTNRDWNWLGHICFRSMLMMLICYHKHEEALLHVSKKAGLELKAKYVYVHLSSPGNRTKS
jgi:hypothetical protein